MALKINNQFSIGETVFLVSDFEQSPRQVVTITLTPIGLMYGIRLDDGITDFYEIELTKEKQVI